MKTINENDAPFHADDSELDNLDLPNSWCTIPSDKPGITYFCAPTTHPEVIAYRKRNGLELE